MLAGLESIEKKLGRAVGQAVTRFDMIAEGDRILVAVSGGKDSFTLLHLLRELQRRAPVEFDLIAVNVNQGHPGFPAASLHDYMAREGYTFRMIEEDTYSIVTSKIPEGKTYCSLCSRLRRGILYRAARELGCNKIALGHHREDILQTLLLNLFFAGQLAAMPPRLLGDQGRTLVIRPLAYCAEGDIRAFAELRGFPIIPCDLCGSQEHLQRKAIAEMLNGIERERPGTKRVMLSALHNTVASHLLDQDLWRKLGAVLPTDDDDAPPDAGSAPRVLLRSLVRE
jgi:tRNA 2-thiocytidine biosynthesis protein TtcA